MDQTHAERPQKYAEVAKAVGVSPTTIRRGVAKGAIRVIRFGAAVRIPADEVRRLQREGLPQ